MIMICVVEAIVIAILASIVYLVIRDRNKIIACIGIAQYNITTYIGIRFDPHDIGPTNSIIYENLSLAINGELHKLLNRGEREEGKDEP